MKYAKNGYAHGAKAIANLALSHAQTAAFMENTKKPTARMGMILATALVAIRDGQTWPPEKCFEPERDQQRPQYWYCDKCRMVFDTEPDLGTHYAGCGGGTE